MSTVLANDWKTLLRDFTLRNAGRITRLEEDDADFGAQVQQTRYPLRGVAYDPHGQAVEIMLGDLGTVEGHLTRSVANVDSVDILTGPDQRDSVLRIAHGNSQTLLRLIL